MVFGFLKRHFARRREPPKPRPRLEGSIRLGDREWRVREERRQGPFPQLFVLSDPEVPASEMHVRVPETDPVVSLEDLEPRALDPTDRWFVDAEGRRWEARIVLPDPPDRRLVKFISWEVGVYEGEWPHPGGLGLQSDDDLRRCLEQIRAAG